MRTDAGLTLVELVITVAVGLLAMTFAAIFWLPGVARESMRGAVFDVQSCIQLARIEAISRNQDCACVINPTSRTLRVFDTKGTTSLVDDEQLHVRELPSTVIFARPTAGPPITLPPAANPGSYSAGFASDGSLASTQGEVYVFGGDRFGRIAVLGAGGTQISRWMNGNWETGS